MLRFDYQTVCDQVFNRLGGKGVDELFEPAVGVAAGEGGADPGGLFGLYIVES